MPAELRERLHLRSGSPLILMDTPHGVVLSTRDQLKQLVRMQLSGGGSLVEELLAERRQLAAAEDVGE